MRLPGDKVATGKTCIHCGRVSEKPGIRATFIIVYETIHVLERQALDNLTLQLGAGISPQIHCSEFFLKTATDPVFPFLHVKLVEADTDTEDVSTVIKVNKTIYKFLKAFSQTDDAVFYITADGSLHQWNSDMVLTIKILSDMKIMSSMDSWTITARKSIANLLDKQKTDLVFDNKHALDKSKELLCSFGILNEVENSDLLFSTATEALKEKAMDSNTLIYRLAMALYHTRTSAGCSIIPAIDDPGSAYLKLVGDPSYERWKSVLSTMMELQMESRLQLTKTLIVFTIASYTYHKIISGASHGN